MTDTNGDTPFIHTDKKSGDIIQSKDWNSAMNEVLRLETAKVNRKGADTIQGPLTIEAALTLNDRVGIGGAPAVGANAEKLKVTGNAAIAGNLSVTGPIKMESGVIQRGGSLVTGTQDLGLYSRVSGQWLRFVTNNAPIHFFTGDGTSGIGSDNRMTIQADGNVGIGTTNPSKKLEVSGDTIITGQLSAASLSVTGNSTLTGSLTVNNAVALKGSAGGTGLIVNASGNVGIGVSSPTARLDVRGGNLQLEGDQKLIFQDSGTNNNLKLQLWSGYGLGINPGILFYTAEGNHSWRDKNSDERMKLTTTANGGLSVLGTGKSSFSGDLEINGNVGIGGAPATGANAEKLKVMGNAAIAGNLSVTGPIKMDSGVIQRGGSPITGTQDLGLYSQVSGQWLRFVTNNASIKFFTGNGNGGIGSDNHMTIEANGNVGIGTQTPDKAKLQITGGSAIKNLAYGYLNASGDKGKGNTGDGGSNFSLYADQRIAASEFNAHSDGRIKQIKGHSNSCLDLKILQKIEVMDYTLKDTIKNSFGVQKKVIGQQVAQIFPQAISMVTEIVPDIFKFASVINGRVILLDHGLRNGERVRIILSDGKSFVLPVEEVSPSEFKVPLNDDKSIFIYGREVDDFHVVDYDALSMLNVSATQELCKIIDGLKVEVQELKNQLESRSPLESLTSAI